MSTAKIVRVRPFEMDDAANFVAAARESASSVGKWMDWCHADYSIEEAQTWIESCRRKRAEGRAYEFALVDPKTDELVGGAGVNQINIDHNFANIGYWVRPSHEGRGIATAAVKLLIEFAFKDYGLTRMEIVLQTDNVSSRRVAEKAGATLETIARNRIFSHGKPREAAIYVLFPEDLQAA